jgi:uncharacterized protein DUF6655
MHGAYAWSYYMEHGNLNKALLLQNSLRSLFLVLFFGLVGIINGCANIRVTDPQRTATEQFLLSVAAVEAVKPLSFEVLHGRKAYIDSAFFAPAEKEFVLGELRAKLLESGVHLLPAREKAEIVIEVRSGGVGIDRYESLLGIPALMAPSAATSAASGTPMATLITPELAISKKIRQVGFASIAYVAYWADSGEIVASSEPSIGKTYREDWWFLGFGPRSVGNIPPVDYDIE